MSFWSSVRRILVGEESPATADEPAAAAATPPAPPAQNGRHPVTITINGSDVSDAVEPRLLLVHFIRENAALTARRSAAIRASADCVSSWRTEWP